MIQSQPIASIALVSLPQFGADEDLRLVMGRYLAEWQVDHAVDAGCTTLIMMGGGGGAEAIAARHEAEKQGLKVREVSGPHALAQSIGPGERLLVMQGDLLPFSADWPADTGQRGAILTFPANTGVRAGFERIDLARAWGGAMVLPGALLPRLLDLPEDAETAPALLRIGLQASIPEHRLRETALADGAWTLLGEGQDARMLEDAWLARRLQPAPDAPASALFASWVLRKWGAGLLGRTAVVPGLFAASLLLAAGGVAFGCFDMAPGGFAAITLGALLLEFALALREAEARRPVRSLAILRHAMDLALLACGAASVQGRWYRQLFPTLMMVIGLNSMRPGATGWRARVGDRALAAALVTLASVSISAEVGMMLAAVVLLARNLVFRRD